MSGVIEHPGRVVEVHDDELVLMEKGQLDDLVRQVDAAEDQIRQERAAESQRRLHDPSTEWFKAHRLSYLQLSRNDANDAPSRAAFYCWAKHNRDGHCPLNDGELQKVSGKPTMPNKEVKRRIIKPAIERGILAPGSVPTCLVTPGYAWFDYGPRTKWCEHHRVRDFEPVTRDVFGASRT